jgi:hypothetical protein
VALRRTASHDIRDHQWREGAENPAGFAILPIRAVLYTLSDNSFWLVCVQVLDGVGAADPLERGDGPLGQVVASGVTLGAAALVALVVFALQRASIANDLLSGLIQGAWSRSPRPASPR